MSSTITLKTPDDQYLAPASVSLLPKRLHKDGIVGCVGKSQKPYEWTYFEGTISTLSGHAWDRSHYFWG
jgi:hypothetical protein